jgi:DNA-binding MarR family transcriptional regulator
MRFMPNGPPAATASDLCTCLLLRKAARRVSQIYDRHLAPFGLTVTQFALLSHVRAYDGIGIGALAGKLVMDPTTLTRNLKPLERDGLIVLAADRNDKRGRNLHLTQAGRDAFKAARPGWQAAQNEIARTLGTQDGPILTAVVDRMLKRLSGREGRLTT